MCHWFRHAFIEFLVFLLSQTDSVKVHCIGINTGFFIMGGNQEEWKRGRERVGREEKEVFVNLFI